MVDQNLLSGAGTDLHETLVRKEDRRIQLQQSQEFEQNSYKGDSTDQSPKNPSKPDDLTAGHKRKLKSAVFYYSMINHFAIEEFFASNNVISLVTLISYYAEPEFLNISDDDLPFFNLLFVSLYTAGNMFGSLSSSFLQKLFNVSYLRIIFKILIVACYMLSLVNEKYLFLSLRIVLGYLVGALQPLNYSEAFRLSPMKQRGVIGIIMSYYVSLGITIGIVLTIPINKGYWNWKVLYLVLASL